jgi:pullulanase
MIRWQNKATNADVTAYYRGLIALRKAHPMFRLASASEVRKALHFLGNLPLESTGYLLVDPTGKDSWSRAAVLFNAGRFPQKFSLPIGGWRVYVTATQAGLTPQEEATSQITGARIGPGILVTVPARSAFVLGEIRS